MAKGKRIPDAVLAVIEETAKQTSKQTAQIMYAERNCIPENCYKQTIKRIKALPILMERVEYNRARLGEDGNLMPGKSKSIVRFSASGVRVDPEEMLEAVRRSVEAHLAADQEEIDEVTCALERVKDDRYYPTVDGLILNKSDEQLAEELYCDESTVRRNRARLIRRIAVFLYGHVAT